MATYLQDPPRKVLVVGNAAIAATTLGHQIRVESRIALLVRLAARDEAVDGGVAAVLFDDLLALAVLEEEECTADDTCDGDDADYDASGDGGFVRAGIVGRSRPCGRRRVGGSRSRGISWAGTGG